MPLLSDCERRACAAFAGLTFGNPFAPDRGRHEHDALDACGRAAATAGGGLWSYTDDAAWPNRATLAEASEALAGKIAGRLAERPAGGEAERDLAAAPGCYALYYRVCDDLVTLDAGGNVRPIWRRFEAGYDELLCPGNRPIMPDLPPGHLFALFFQIRRAFAAIYDGLWGAGRAAGELRADVWHGVFTRDRRRYAAVLFDRMHEMPTLVLGESGTGKEVVARALARSRYRAFDAGRCAFEAAGAFEPVSLAALPATLVESDLFGHRRGSFTGAVADRPGRLEHVGRGGTVLLDEVGDLEAAVQVKLLRVLQERVFHRVGDHGPREARRFEGKLVAATHRDLPGMARAGTFRGDLYYRLAGDTIRTPPLRELVAGDADELARLAGLVCRRLLPPGAGEQAAALAGEVVSAIDAGVGVGHAWPGNFRELEQCCRNVLVRGRYDPLDAPPPADEADALAGRLRSLDLTADALLTAYCRLARDRLGTDAAAARALGLDRRTVRARVAPLEKGPGSAAG